MRRFVAPAALLAVLLVLSTSTPVEPAASEDEWVVPGQLLVRFRDGAEFPATMPQGATYNPTLNVWRIDVGSPSAATDLETALRADPSIELVQPQHRYTNAAAPSDPRYLSYQHVHTRIINAEAGWEVGVPPQEVIVAVIDDGVDVGQPDLDERIWRNAAETPGNGIDDDGNGCIDDVTGCSFLTAQPDGHVHDLGTHGTFVAGLIAAEWDGLGVAGIAQNALIMPVRALDADAQTGGTTEDVAESILYAARNGADVINLSLTKPPVAGVCPREELLEEALREAHEVYGVTIVSVTGNFAEPCVGFPGSSQYAMAVAASGPAENSDTRAEFSNWGPEVDVAAPGVLLASTCPTPTLLETEYCPGGPYGVGNGTSFSAPMVSAIAALILGHEPQLTNGQVEQRLRETARDVPDDAEPNWDGAGIVDVGAAVGAGSAFTSLDTSGRFQDLLTAAVEVGDAATPDCSATIWQQASLGTGRISSTFGVGECAAFWPPTASRPWNLSASSAGGKGIVINSWRVSSNELSCHARAGPHFLAPGESVRLQLDCTGTGDVANDTMEGAIEVLGPFPRRFEQDVRYATADDDPGASCVGAHGHSVWYRFPAESAKSVAAETFGSDFDTVIAVYRAAASGVLEEIDCSDQIQSTGNSRSRVVWTTDGSSDYVVMAGAAGMAPPGRLRLQFSDAPVPANDFAASPLSLSRQDAFPVVQPAHLASSQAGDPTLSCVAEYEASLWFRVTAASEGQLAVTTSGSTYDTVLAIFEPGVSRLTEVACNDQAGPNINTSRATWTPQPGREYLVMAGSYVFPGALEPFQPPGVLKIAVSGR